MRPAIDTIRLDAKILAADELSRFLQPSPAFADAHRWAAAWIDSADITEETKPERLAFAAARAWREEFPLG